MNTVEIDLDALEPVAAECTDTELRVTLADGVTVATPLWWYPRLLAANPADRARVELMAFGVHWPRAPGATPPAVP